MMFKGINSPFSVVIASAGRFHAFDLSLEMQKRGVLRKLFTFYPKFKVKEIQPQYLKTAPWLAIPQAVLGRIGLYAIQDALFPSTDRAFDFWLSKNLEYSDIFHCLSGYGLRSHRVARETFGAFTLCDRTSAHIEIQRDLLLEEYSRWGIVPNWNDRVTQLGLQEYEECDLIVTPSNFVWRSFVAKGFSRDKLALVPLGVDLSLFHRERKEDTVFRVIYAGSLCLRKGIPYLLQAFTGLDLPNFEVWLIGGMTEEIKEIVQQYPGPFKYLSFIPRTNLSWYYSQGSVFVLPSIEDGFGMVQSQAMSCGLPVIATTNTGADNLFTDGVEGFIIPIRDPQIIREKVLYLYENPQIRDEMANLALARVQSLGGWHTYGEEMIQVYRNIMARRAQA